MLPNKKFKIIYADPPWQYKNRSLNGAADKHYSTMSLSDLCQLPINQISESDSVLFMWHVPPMPAEALALVNAWGFKLKNFNAFVWAKQTVKGSWFFGPGHYTRAGSECCLVATKGKGLKRASASVRSLLVAPVGRHSAKPSEVRDRIVKLYGDVPRVELFARERAEGWDSWGNEL